MINDPGVNALDGVVGCGEQLRRAREAAGLSLDQVAAQLRMPQQVVAALEAEQKQIQDALADGSLFASDNTKAVAMHQRDAEIDEALMEALERWTALSE